MGVEDGGERAASALPRRGELLKSPFLIPSESCLVSTKRNRIILQVYVGSAFLCSSVPSRPGPDCPLPPDVPALFEYELFYGGTLNINLYKERMYGQFPVVSLGRHRRADSPCGGGAGAPWEGAVASPVPWSLTSSRAAVTSRGASLDPGLGLRASAGVLCSHRRAWEPLCASGPANLDGLLILTDVALGLFYIKFLFSKE